MADERDTEFEGISHAEYLTMVDRLRSRVHPKIDRNDSGAVVYPRKEYLQAQAAERKRLHDEAMKNKK